MSSARKMFAAALVGGALALSTVAGAFAFHPGHNDNPGHQMPQGPNLIACNNQGGALNPSGNTASLGGWGVHNAIDRGGMVHCVEDE